MDVTEKLFEYLSKKIEGFQKIQRGQQLLFTCPRVKEHKFQSRNPTAQPIPQTNRYNCLICGWKGTAFDIVRLLEEDKKYQSDAEITEYLIGNLHLDIYKELAEYQKYNFSLIPLLKNSKVPFEKDWVNTEHREKTTWVKWLNNGLNIGLNCSQSKVTVVDVDLKVAPTQAVEEIYKQLVEANTLEQTTPHGKHFVFLFDKEIQQATNIGNLHIDIRNEGGQIVVAPSKIDASVYKWVNLGAEIKQIPATLKQKILSLKEADKDKKSSSDIKESEVTILKEGDGRNNVLMSIGGALINKFTVEDTAYILSMVSQNFMSPPLPFHEIKAMLGSLDNYKLSAELTQEQQCYEVLRLLQQTKAREIHEHYPQLPTSVANKYLAKFVQEGKAIRLSHGLYQWKEKIEWSSAVPAVIEEYPYKVPFFNNIAIFQDADCIILGGKTNEGKTTVALNMLQSLIAQGVKPYYVYTEAGSRFQKTAQMLGIEGKFFHCQHSNPLAIELEANAFTIIDWLFLENKAETDVVLKHINDELQRKRGMLIVFTQLKTNYEYFAPNLIDHFPTFAARYIQDNQEHTEGHWQADKIKESRGNYTSYILPCTYNQQTRVFKLKEMI